MQEQRLAQNTLGHKHTEVCAARACDARICRLKRILQQTTLHAAENKHGDASLLPIIEHNAIRMLKLKIMWAASN